MKISDAGLALICSFEGYHDKLPDGSCRAYLDRLAKPNIWTIGWGCTEGVKAGMVWSKAEAEAALRREVAKFEAAVDRLVTVELNQNQFDALVSFAYNCGSGALAKSSVLKYTNAGEFRKAASSFKLWNKAGGKVWPGLVDRRAREATLFLTPVDVPDAPAMPQAVEPSPEPVSKTSIGTIATGVGVAGGAAGVSTIPPPPPEVTESVTNLGIWQTALTTATSFMTFAQSNRLLTGGVILAIAAVWLLPRLSR